MKLQSFEYFVAIAEELHFGKAAARLQITQPALSRQLQNLEAELGVQLIMRTKRTVELTEAGATFLSETRKALQQIDTAVQVAQRVARGEVGSLRIAFTASAMHTVLPDILKQFCDLYPQVQLTMNEICTIEQVQALTNDAVDVGFLHPPINAPQLELHPLPGESLVVALPQQHPLAQKKQIPFQALANESFILHPRYEGPVLYDQILSLCRNAKFEPNVVHEEVKNQTRIGLVAAGMGITFVPKSLQASGISGITYRELVPNAPQLQLALAWRKISSSSVVDRFVQMTQQC